MRAARATDIAVDSHRMPRASPLRLPAGLTDPDNAWPIVFIDAGDVALANLESLGRVNGAIRTALERVHRTALTGQCLLKVHVGEPECTTRMRPEYVPESAVFLRDRGASSVVAGDTTVAYSGPRGHKRNPVDDVTPYLELAREHGWSQDGAAGVPFVVLDRPYTAVPGWFRFEDEKEQRFVDGVRRFRDFWLAGGFASSDFVVDHVHLTLHGLAGFAGCIKGLAMGCSSLEGKLRMHQSLLPSFDADACQACGQCVESCPEGALTLDENDPGPRLDPNSCIGCGECEAVCAVENGAVKLRPQAIEDWGRGQDTLPVRMADYTIGLMNGRWQSTIHVLHMYSVTERCDCLNVRQKPMLERDLGFLVGKNPFAIDRLAERMLAQALDEEGRKADGSLTGSAERTATYVLETYGIVADAPVETMAVR